MKLLKQIDWVPVVPLEQVTQPKVMQADPIDLLAGLDVNEAPQAPAASTAPVASDPFGGFSELIVESDAANGGIKPQLEGGTIEGWYSKLCLSNKGILYQDQFLHWSEGRISKVSRSNYALLGQQAFGWLK